jgi:hypothetical protein
MSIISLNVRDQPGDLLASRCSSKGGVATPPSLAGPSSCCPACVGGADDLAESTASEVAVVQFLILPEPPYANNPPDTDHYCVFRRRPLPLLTACDTGRVGVVTLYFCQHTVSSAAGDTS